MVAKHPGLTRDDESEPILGGVQEALDQTPDELEETSKEGKSGDVLDGEDDDDDGPLNLLERLIRSGASLGVFVAAALGVWQYYEANQEIKRERSLEIVKDWNEGGYIDRFSKLQEFVETRVSTTRMPPPEIGEQSAIA